MSNNTTEPLFPSIDWCFDIETYYASSGENMAVSLRKSFQEYKKFSFRYNGVLTTLLVTLGLSGSLLLLMQIHRSRLFSKRLAVHLGMICIWDSLYLISCLTTYAIPSLLYGMPPIYGIISYVLIILQPFASFCVSCTIWQVVAITLERYWAVTKPLEQRTRKARFGVFSICLAIVVGAFILNLLPVPFERHLVPCFEIVDNTIRYSTLLKPYDDNESRLYRFVVHFFPDLLFRTPCPIIIIGVLTVKTIQVCNQRTFGNLLINTQMKRNIPLRLSLLNFKFILCNTLYMFNTILLELLGYGDAANEEGQIDRYMNSYYLTDASNMLLVVHSTTNWLLFYHWPKYNKKKRRHLASVTLTSSTRHFSIRTILAEYVLKKISPVKTSLGIEIITKLCEDYTPLSAAIVGAPAMIDNYNHLDKNVDVKNVGEKVGLFIEQVLKWFADRGHGENIRDLGRRLGEAHFNSNVHFTAEQWKDIRKKVVDIIVQYVYRDDSKNCSFSEAEISESLTKVFNLVLSEMRSGTLCAAVEAHQRSSRSHSTCEWTSHKEVQRKSKSISYAKVRQPTCEEMLVPTVQVLL